MNLLATLQHQIWSMDGRAHRALEASARSIATLVSQGMPQPTAGLSPSKLPEHVFNGGNPIVPEVNGGTATIEIFGSLIARCPWWAKSYLGAVDQFDIADAIDSLVSNSAITDLVMEMDTCGGSTTGTAEVVSAMNRFRATGRTITVRAAGTLASAGYWIASAADRIEATVTTRIGSLGTMVVLCDDTAAQTADGVRYEVIASADGKGLGMDGSITPALREQMKSLVLGLTAVFRDQVAAGRGIADPSSLFTGECWLASQAQSLGLIDAITSPADELDQPTGTTPAPTPIAPALDSEESTMDAKTLAKLSELSAANPTHAAAMVAAANMPGASPEAVSTALENSKGLAAGEAIKAELTQVKAELATATAALETEKTAHAATKTNLTDITAKASKLGLVASGASPDPGGDAGAKEVPNEAKWRAEFANSAELQDGFYAGVESYVAHKHSELAKKSGQR